MNRRNPAWWLRFGLLKELERLKGQPPAPENATGPAFDGNETGLLYRAMAAMGQGNSGESIDWDWSAYCVHFEDLCRLVGPPRCFDTRMPVQHGSGDAHVLEGPALRLNLFGAPMIDAATIKGMCRAARGALASPGGDEADRTLVAVARNRSFGTPRRRGEAAFHSALWVPPDSKWARSDSDRNPFCLELDNSHGDGEPGTEPIPVWRLAAQGRFAFWLEGEDDPCSGRGEGAAMRWTELAWRDLAYGLEQLGLGSRRNIDFYGRMRAFKGSEAG